MEIIRKGHQFTVIEECGKFVTVMILSRHNSLDEALDALFEAMEKESEEISKAHVEELRSRGIKAVTVKEALEGKTPEERAAFLKERNEKFLIPLMDKNIEELKNKEEELKAQRKIRRVK